MSAGDSMRTTDHQTIKQWAEERNAEPAVVEDTWDGDSGVLRFDFPYDGKDKSLKTISWEEFFKVFDNNDLEFLYQNKLESGKQSNFFKFVAKA